MVPMVNSKMHAESAVEPELEALNAALDDGYTFIAFGVDIRLLDLAARKGPLDFNGARA